MSTIGSSCPGESTATHRTVARAEREGSNGWITTKVKSEPLADSVGRGLTLHVKTEHGVVSLSSNVPNEDAAAHVKDVAEKMQAIKRVDASALHVTAG